ncbi:hypothetical protein HA41_12905 [Pantoea conspicua]|uniref:Uncharacterized protein n=1 Tax=Pantoea conspicua TaxID=472705 RepID=A0A1X1BUP4_9GAMM|nr:hypothetical protein HA41_12905 [Pantoea conspicua]
MIPWLIIGELRISPCFKNSLPLGLFKNISSRVKQLLKCASATKSDKTQVLFTAADSDNRCKRIHLMKKSA